MQNKSKFDEEYGSDEREDFEQKLLVEHNQKPKMQRGIEQNIKFEEPPAKVNERVTNSDKKSIKDTPGKDEMKENEIKAKRDKELRIIKQKQEQENKNKSKTKEVRLIK